MLKNKKYFSRYAWGYLIYNFYVILGGAYVRATGSGAGCGAHWPLCEGEVVPNFNLMHTIIEFTHRASSGIVTLGAVLLVCWAFLSFHKFNPVRKFSLCVFGFIIIEALLGAILVKFSLVANNSSNFRAVMMAMHLVTTLLLLASITLTAAWSSGVGLKQQGTQHKLNYPRYKIKLGIFIAFIALLIVGASGAITALGDTLFRPLYVGEGLVSDMHNTSSILKSIRIYHPVLAIITSFYIVLFCLKLAPSNAPKIHSRLCLSICITIALQIILGLVNIILLAPIWMQIIHLFTADLLWVLSIIFFNSILYVNAKKISTQ